MLSPRELVLFLGLFAIGTVSFLGILGEISKLFSSPVPAYGGMLKEGIIGNPKFANPILAQTDADRDIVALTFVGLMRHDKNGELANALAEKVDISDDGLTYKVTLRNAAWPDGTQITSNDVAFTMRMAKNPQIQSPRRANWEGVEVEKTDEQTVQFRLKKPYAQFAENLTMGILPEHLWKNIPLSQFSIADMNINPVGAGPYLVERVEKTSQGFVTTMTLKANKNFALGRPNIKKIKLYFYQNTDEVLKALKARIIDATGFLSANNVKSSNKRGLSVNVIRLRRIIAIFFNQNSNKILSSAKIRAALDASLDKQSIVNDVLGGYGSVIAGPIPDSNQKPEPPDYNFAKNTISKSKDNVEFIITTANTTPSLTATAEKLKAMWEAVGAKIDIKTFGRDDLEQAVIGPRQYDAFLIGIETIGKNPDLFAFWHSSQRTHPGLNIALYANSKVDSLLEKARTERDGAKQQEIYSSIENEIQKDIPAIFLYSPSYLYVAANKLKGIAVNTINTASERFETVNEWYLEEDYVWKIFHK